MVLQIFKLAALNYFIVILVEFLLGNKKDSSFIFGDKKSHCFFYLLPFLLVSNKKMSIFIRFLFKLNNQGFIRAQNRNNRVLKTLSV